MNRAVRVNRTLTIPGDEIQLRFSTSGGPGGQHANKAATRVDLTWNVDESRALGPRQRARIKSRLGRRIDSAGNLHLSSDARRSQMRNREEVMERLARTIAQALKREKQRVTTGPTRAAKERRLKEKRRRSDLKKSRRVSFDD
jgi:ribosome-associated protein